MEVLYHQPQPLLVFGGGSLTHHQTTPLSAAAAAAAMVFPVNHHHHHHLSSHQLSVPPASAGHALGGSPSSPAPYTCYPFQTTPSPYTPSRTPTPEAFPPARSASRESSSAASGSSAQESQLIKSVLRGEVPKEYAHLMQPSSSSSSSSPSPSSSFMTHRHHHHHHHHHHPHHRSPARSPVSSFSSSDRRLGAGMSSSSSSLAVVASTPVLSPPPEDVQTEPMDLSCKRPASSSSRLSGSSCTLRPSSTSPYSPSPALLSASAPSSSSSAAAFHHTLPPSPCEEGHGQQGQDGEFSLLRNLLEVGHGQAIPHHPHHQPHHHSHPQPPSSPAFHPLALHHHPSSSPARPCDSPCSGFGTPPSESFLSGSTQVTLTRDNLYNISARVSDWLMRMVHFAWNIPCFQDDLDYDDRCLLLLSSWSRLLLLFMAESNFQFEVAPLVVDPPQPSSSSSEMDICSGGGGGGGSGSAGGAVMPDQPTVKSVEGIRSFIGKCQKMEVEAEEYGFLRMLVLFNGGHLGIREASRVEAINLGVTASLREHVQRTHPGDPIRYSRLLLTLPALYGISDKMVNQLFCQHMDSDSITNVEVLLKKLLRTLCPEGRR